MKHLAVSTISLSAHPPVFVSFHSESEDRKDALAFLTLEAVTEAMEPGLLRDQLHHALLLARADMSAREHARIHPEESVEELKTSVAFLRACVATQKAALEEFQAG